MASPRFRVLAHGSAPQGCRDSAPLRPLESRGCHSQRGEDRDKDLLYHPKLSRETRHSNARGHDRDTGDSRELGPALGSKKQAPRNAPEQQLRTMGPLIGLQPAVKQVVPERLRELGGTGRAWPLLQEVLPAAPSAYPTSPAASKSSSQAARIRSGRGQSLAPGSLPATRLRMGTGTGSCCAVQGETGGVPVPELPKGAQISHGCRGICLCLILSASPVPCAPAQQAGTCEWDRTETPGVGEDKDMDPEILSLAQSSSGTAVWVVFPHFLVWLSTSCPSHLPGLSSLQWSPRRGQPHATLPATAVHRGVMEPGLCQVVTGQEETPSTPWGPD